MQRRVVVAGAQWLPFVAQSHRLRRAAIVER